MTELNPVLEARSPLEAYLYTRVARCARCDGGPLRGTGRIVTAGAEGYAVDLVCGGCGGHSLLRFTLPLGSNFGEWPGDLVEALRMAPGDPLLPDVPRLSRIIDVADWITLHAMIIREAQAAETGGGADAETRRRLNLLAGACLDEALAFYDVDNDLPPADGFFCDRSRQAFEERPQAFARQRLVDLRGSLPVAHRTMRGDEPVNAEVPSRRAWWAFWRRG